MERNELKSYLKGGLFISAMMGITDGAWVSQRAQGARMVQIGALIADLKDRSHEARFLLPESEEHMIPIMKKHVDSVREKWRDLPVALNGASGDLESVIRMARAFKRAGGDLFELNCHGGYEKLLERGLLRAMVLPENRIAMHEWLVELCRLSIPVVVKFNATMKDVDFSEVLDGVSDVHGLFGVHFNIRSEEDKKPNTALIKQIRSRVNGMIFCSGYVRTRSQVTELLAAGGDCIGIAQGLRDDPGIIERLSSPSDGG
jgi:tRNA-dihydrouridine synthase